MEIITKLIKKFNCSGEEDYVLEETINVLPTYDPEILYRMKKVHKEILKNSITYEEKCVKFGEGLYFNYVDNTLKDTNDTIIEYCSRYYVCRKRYFTGVQNYVWSCCYSHSEIHDPLKEHLNEIKVMDIEIGKETKT
jgi:hypothetical protein